MVMGVKKSILNLTLIKLTHLPERLQCILIDHNQMLPKKGKTGNNITLFLRILPESVRIWNNSRRIWNRQ
ncbi:hypothetical protein A4R26_31210 [Niastella populi]|uniref:Uncharacterized protein n=1 Tax=Niastella populi TaxID=550983 RepID=A0A1V9ERX0_9BACT|nr:hypothetical protein A4R26_31210 [Niastella populi]